jgi:hypothetical protein
VPPKVLPRRPTGSVTHTNLTATYPVVVADYAWAIRSLIDIGRDRILWAASVAAVLEPPDQPTAYPNLDGPGTVCTVPYTATMYRVVRIAGKRWFYRRQAWLAYFGMTERYDLTIAILRLFAPELDELEVTALTRLSEVTPTCPVPPVRAPTSRRPPEEMTTAAKQARSRARAKARRQEKAAAKAAEERAVAPKKTKKSKKRKGPKKTRAGWRKAKPPDGSTSGSSSPS